MQNPTAPATIGWSKHTPCLRWEQGHSCSGVGEKQDIWTQKLGDGGEEGPEAAGGGRYQAGQIGSRGKVWKGVGWKMQESSCLTLSSLTDTHTGSPPSTLLQLI